MQGNLLKTTVFFNESFFCKFNRLDGFKGTIVAICDYCHTVILLNLMEENSELCKKY